MLAGLVLIIAVLGCIFWCKEKADKAKQEKNEIEHQRQHAIKEQEESRRGRDNWLTTETAEKAAAAKAAELYGNGGSAAEPAPKEPGGESRSEKLYQPARNNLILLHSQWTPDPDREMAGTSTNVYFDKASGQFFSQRCHDDGASFHGSFSSLYSNMEMERGLAIARKHCKPSVYQRICEVLKDRNAEDKPMGVIWEAGGDLRSRTMPAELEFIKTDEKRDQTYWHKYYTCNQKYDYLEMMDRVLQGRIPISDITIDENEDIGAKTVAGGSYQKFLQDYDRILRADIAEIRFPTRYLGIKTIICMYGDRKTVRIITPKRDVELSDLLGPAAEG